MYQPMLFIHWKQVRVALIPFVIASFGLPLLTVQGLGTPDGMQDASMTAYRVITQAHLWLPLFPLLAAAIGATLALSAWNWDHQLNHVYALSLPLPRWEYAALKMGAGGLLALLPAAALWIGAMVATAAVDLPAGLHAYPTLLAVRFFAATLLVYALFFAMAAGTVRTTIWLLSGVVGLLVVAMFANDLLATHFELLQRENLLTLFFKALLSLPGPFQVFSGNWTLIDV